ncbi:cell division protein FtsX [Desulfurivibrio alkaliphilus]|uniref:Cell division protein FtsX n=1 Tax=Desulfurivibrio alkaliphilus (strain DSM 19089 / UNIQEM U267 / AHT2) TaxID=589865 RepID=D6Z2W9_DESAT|nr:permease-like cell division protein FtsX [Desulfurivibrio alkaliphilus]ADH85894.1 protein of unknown function DUF214 [Desulfurivibrio alkaliphilus AHT 2]
MKSKPHLSTFLAAILQQAGRNLARSWPTQLMSLLTVALSVLIFSFFLLIHLNMMAAGAKLGDDLRLTVYLAEEIHPSMQPRVREQIHQFGDIAEVRFVSRQQAMTRFAEHLGEEREILVDLEPDFLPPSIEVIPRPGLLGLGELEQLADFLTTLPHVSRVQYGQEWLLRFNSFNRLLRVVVLISATLLTLNMIFTVSRTIQLTVAARREELEILRLLGADRAFVGTPFLAEGLLQGGLGSMLGLGLLYLLFQWAAAQLEGAGVLALFTPVFVPSWLLVLIIGASALLCLFSSLAAINKSLRV